MSLKKKFIGLGLLACLVAVPLLLVTASASNKNGHFVTEGAERDLIGTQSATHMLEFTVDGLAGGIVCDQVGLLSRQQFETESLISFNPGFAECHTTNSATKFQIKSNTCALYFYVAQGTTDATEQTGKLDCGATGKLEIMHPNCTITVPTHASLTGITYTTITLNNKHAITVDLNVPLNMQTHGACGAANKTGKLKGSFTIEAYTAVGGTAVHLTAT